MDALQQGELDIVSTYLEGSEDNHEYSKEMFKVNDLDSLNWVFRKVSALKAKEKEIQKLANVERDRINRWETNELRPLKNSLEFFEMLVAEYHQKVLEEDPRAKTISTPYGKSKTRKSKETTDKQDEKILLEHVLESEMYDFVKQSLSWGDFKKTLKIVDVSGEKVVVDINGQIVPGVTVKPESIKYTIEVD
jgi:sulfur carrier protein ThiS